jgi:membrane-associated phospholipid phosphatase
MDTMLIGLDADQRTFVRQAKPATVRNRMGRLLRAAALVAAMAPLAPLHAQDDETAVAAHYPHGNAVADWNSFALEVFAPSQGTNPMLQSRTLAIFHASIHDALNAIQRRFKPYTPGLTAAAGTSPEAAVAAAAREVLATLLPDQQAHVDAAYQETLAAIQDGPAKAAGIAAGRAAARANLARRQGDGHDTAAEPAYVPQPGAGEYQFTPPFDFAAQPGWGRVRPFVIVLEEHALRGPLALSSARYARDLAQVKAIGRVDSTTRTAEQAEIAQFWYEDSPLGWNRIANTVVRQKALDPWVAARAFALVNFAMADGFIAGFETKYHFRFWRPETAIREAATDGNPRTEMDATWQPFLTTPPVPDYPSTHTVLGAAAAEVLAELFGDRVRYSTTSLTLPGVTRQFQGFSMAARENGLSRIFAGIHFRHAVQDGHRQGRSVGQAVSDALEPVRGPRPHGHGGPGSADHHATAD